MKDGWCMVNIWLIYVNIWLIMGLHGHGGTPKWFVDLMENLIFEMDDP